MGIGLAEALRPFLPDWVVAAHSKGPRIDDRASDEKIGGLAPEALIVRAVLLQQARMRLAKKRWIGTVYLRRDGQTIALRPDAIEQSVARILDPDVGVSQ